MNKLLVSASPHINGPHTVKSIMQDVCLALMPATLVGIFAFGFYPVVVILITIASALMGEYLFNVITKSPNTTNDWSAVVTGLLLALNLPPVVPLYVPLVGGFFATMVVKMLFGGLGKNFANPAITARIFLVLAWASAMSTYVAPLDYSEGIGVMFKYFGNAWHGTIDTVTSATPLAFVKSGDLGSIRILDMFFGYIGGSLGEVSAFALLLGGLYLVFRKVLDWKIPVIYIGTVALLSLIFKGYEYVLPMAFGGGLFLGAIFMASDYSTSPNSHTGIIIYSVGLGVLTFIIRIFSKMPESVSFSILLMNIVTPLIDKYIIPKPFGYIKPVKAKEEKA